MLLYGPDGKLSGAISTTTHTFEPATTWFLIPSPSTILKARCATRLRYRPNMINSAKASLASKILLRLGLGMHCAVSVNAPAGRFSPVLCSAHELLNPGRSLSLRCSATRRALSCCFAPSSLLTLRHLPCSHRSSLRCGLARCVRRCGRRRSLCAVSLAHFVRCGRRCLLAFAARDRAS